MADVFPNLSDDTVRTVVQNLGIYVASQELEGLLRSFDALAGDVDGSLPAATTTTIGGVLKSASVADLTNSTGGTSGGNTVAAVALATAATTGADTATLPTLTSVNASITSLRNGLATLTVKQNAILAALRAAGIMA